MTRSGTESLYEQSTLKSDLWAGNSRLSGLWHSDPAVADLDPIRGESSSETRIPSGLIRFKLEKRSEV